MNAETKIEVPDNVYARIAIVQGRLAKVGIEKDRQAQGYKFRGIDDVYNALAPLLAECGLCILPRILSREVTERKTNKGAALFVVTVEAEFDFVSTADGSVHTVRTIGEAMDMSDKATNKAMSAAYKYAAFMTFAIPTEGDSDSEGAHHTEPPMAEDIREKIISLCEAVGGNQAKIICDAYRVQSIPELTLAQALKVISRLEEKLSEKAKAETDAKAETVDA